MKKIFFFTGVSLLAFLFVPNVFADFNFQNEKAKCSRIKDRVERSDCYAAVYLEKEKSRRQQSKTTEVTGKNESLFCQLKVGTAAKKKCENEIKAAQKEKILELQKKAEEKKEAEKKAEETGEKEIFLKVIPCEKKETQMEKILCYNEFHKQQQVKKETALKVKSEKKAFVSPTLQKMKCRKMKDREERNQCYQDLRNADREERYKKREEEEKNFSEVHAHKECLNISNSLNRAKCFNNLDKIERRLADDFEEENKLP